MNGRILQGSAPEDGAEYMSMRSLLKLTLFEICLCLEAPLAVQSPNVLLRFMGT